nr:hypothetical protein [Frankia gtarii]
MRSPTSSVLVESRDAFVHNVATLRGVVDPGWAELQSGTRIAADCVVLATGSAYPYPAKIDAVDSGSAISTLRGTHDGVARAGRAPSRVTTEAGEDITVDVWFACYGASVDSDYLDTPSCARPGSPTGGWPSPRKLRVRGQEAVFAVGDVTALPELKMARPAQKHAEVVAANIRTLIQGGGDLVEGQPEPDAVVLIRGQAPADLPRREISDPAGRRSDTACGRRHRYRADVHRHSATTDTTDRSCRNNDARRQGGRRASGRRRSGAVAGPRKRPRHPREHPTG